MGLTRLWRLAFGRPDTAKSNGNHTRRRWLGAKRQRSAPAIALLENDTLNLKLSPTAGRFMDSNVVIRALSDVGRNARGMAGLANTMLVHVSQLTTDQERVAHSIEEQVDLWCDANRQGQDIESLLFASVWNEMKLGLTSVPDDAPVLRDAVRVLHSLVVVRLNSVAGEDLEYDTKPGRHIIAVGGSRSSTCTPSVA